MLSPCNGRSIREYINYFCKMSLFTENAKIVIKILPDCYGGIFGFMSKYEKEMDDVEFETRVKELSTEFKTLTLEAHELEEKIEEDWGKIT